MRRVRLAQAKTGLPGPSSLNLGYFNTFLVHLREKGEWLTRENCEKFVIVCKCIMFALSIIGGMQLSLLYWKVVSHLNVKIAGVLFMKFLIVLLLLI